MLIKHYDDRFLSCPEFYEFQKALGEKVLQLRQDIGGFTRQLSPLTADYGLETWEKALGLTVDVSKSYIERRERIISKLRGAGAATSELIKSIAASFVFGEVELTEYPADYSFTLFCSGQLGIPQNYSNLKAAVDEVKPAHLAVLFIFEYYRIRDIHGALTIGELQTKKLNMFKGGD